MPARDAASQPSFEAALAIGERLSVLGQSDRRLALREANAFLDRVGRRAPRAVRAVARRARAHALRGCKEYRAALRDYRTAMRDFAKARLPVEGARTAIGLCDTLLNLDRPAEALPLARAARRTLRAAGEWRRAARLDVNLANLLLRQDQTERALLHYRAAEEWFERAGHELDLAIARFNVGNLLAERGELTDAAATLGSSADLLARQGAAGALLQCRLAHANVLARLGRVRESLHTLDETSTSSAALENAHLRAMAAIAAARVHLSIGRDDRAGPLLDRAIETFGAITLGWDQAEALVLRARLHARAARAGLAEADLRAAERMFATIGQRSMASWVEVERLRLSGADGIGPAERARLVRAIERFRRGRHGAFEAEARLFLAECERLRATSLARATARHQRGRAYARQQLARVRILLRRHPDPWLEQRWMLEAVASRSARGGKALALLERAAAIGESLRAHIPTEALRATFSANQSAIVERAIDLLLDPALGAPDEERIRAAFIWAERAHVPRLGAVRGPAAPGVADATLLDGIAERRAELDRMDAESQASRRTSAHRQHREQTVHRLQRLIERLETHGERAVRRRWLGPSHVAALQRRLEPGERLVEYFVGSRGIHVFVVARDRLVHVRVSAAVEEVRALVFRLGRLWQRLAIDSREGGPGRDALAATERELLARLYDDLLAPVFAATGPAAGGGRLTIVPHEWLREVPFHALGPLDVGYELRARDRLTSVARPRATGRPLVVGVASEGAPTAEDEARAVAALHAPSDLVCGAEATADAVRARWARAPLIHVASHATREVDEPRLSGVQLREGSWTAFDIAAHGLAADLVVLSGCRTGDAVVWGGDEAFGLLPALMERGARAVLVSLWPVADAAALDWMVAFHGALARGESMAAAWRSAVGRVRSAAGSAYLWAPFALYGGSPRPRRSLS